MDSCRSKGSRLLTTNYCALIVPGKLYPLLMLEVFVEFGMMKVYISFNSCFFPLLTLIGPCYSAFAFVTVFFFKEIAFYLLSSPFCVLFAKTDTAFVKFR